MIGGFTAKQMGLELPETVAPVARALILGGIAIFAVDAYARRQPRADALTWRVAFWVGIGQILAAVFPGTSRSAATIFAATAYEAFDLYQSGHVAEENWTELGMGFVVSAVVAFVAVKWLLRYVQTHSFTPFGWYRIALGLLLVATVD